MPGAAAGPGRDAVRPPRSSTTGAGARGSAAVFTTGAARGVRRARGAYRTGAFTRSTFWVPLRVRYERAHAVVASLRVRSETV